MGPPRLRDCLRWETQTRSVDPGGARGVEVGPSRRDAIQIRSERARIDEKPIEFERGGSRQRSKVFCKNGEANKAR